MVSDFTVGQHSAVLVPHVTGLLDEDHFGWFGDVLDPKEFDRSLAFDVVGESDDTAVKKPMVTVGVDVVGLGVERRLPQAVVVALPNGVDYFRQIFCTVVIGAGHQTDEFSIQQLKIIRRKSSDRQQFVKQGAARLQLHLRIAGK